jgi:hypothetical protein
MTISGSRSTLVPWNSLRIPIAACGDFLSNTWTEASGRTQGFVAVLLTFLLTWWVSYQVLYIIKQRIHAFLDTWRFGLSLGTTSYNSDILPGFLHSIPLISPINDPDGIHDSHDHSGVLGYSSSLQH